MAPRPTGRPRGHPPKPIEQKRRLGNPGKRALPEPANLVALPAPSSPPEPARPLGLAGREFWERLWGGSARHWLTDADAELALIVAEQLDEYASLRVRVIRDGNWRDRAALRHLTHQIVCGLALLACNPVDRSRVGVEVRRGGTSTALQDLMRRREPTT